jgi:phosphate transport system substrate-binding protein
MTGRWFTCFALALLLLTGCGKKDESAQGQPGTPSGPVSLNGAGATFPYPLYSKWMAEYNRLHPDVRINYQSIGSGGGIRQIMSGTVDFGATDTPMTSDEASKAPRTLHHIPTTIGAVVVAYNLAGLTGLKLDTETLADIFLGKITKWNDPRLVALNAGTALPDQDIKVVYRSDGSGTTGVFTEYLAKVSPAWKSQVGEGKSVKWPVGLGAKGNEGVSGQVKTVPGAIGYTELAYAKQNAMSMASLKNKSGEFIAPAPEASTLAAKGVELPESLYVSFTDSPAAGAYPLAAYTYVLVYEDQKDPVKGGALAKFLMWALSDGQKHATELHYAPLPEATVAKAKARLGGLRAGDKKLLAAN